MCSCPVHRLFVLAVVLATVDSQTTRKALVIIDVQTCFTEGGTLEVTNGNQVIPVINQLRRTFPNVFDLVVFSQDWHCKDHVSFYTQFVGHQAYDVVSLFYKQNGELCLNENVTSKYAVNCTGEVQKLEQTLWPPHCVINTTDAQLHPDITRRVTDVTVRKGYNCQLDSYSVFYDNGNFDETEMNELLQKHRIDSVFITGLAQDYCVFWTAKDALRLGYVTYVIEDATRPVSNDTGVEAIREMKAKGIHVVQSDELEEIFTINKACKKSSVPILTILIAVVLHVHI